MSTDDLPALGEFVPSAEVLEALEQTLKIDVDDTPADVERPDTDGASPAVPATTDDADITTAPTGDADNAPAADADTTGTAAADPEPGVETNGHTPPQS
ncbi:MAG: hypothetical protein AAF531_25580, partial [Actinomycetota bacterium]